MILRLTVRCDDRRRDLVLPATVPVVELVPELARVVGALGAETGNSGFRLLGCDGRALEAGGGLGAQGVRDGDTLLLVHGAPKPDPAVHDDAPEAMASVVAEVPAWDAATRRGAAMGAAGVLLVAGAAALLLLRATEARAESTVTAAVTAGVLATCSMWARRLQRADDAAVVSAWLAAGYAAVGGFLAAPGGRPGVGSAMAAAGAGVLVVCLVLGAGAGPRRAGLVPPAAAGTLLVVTGLVRQELRWGAGVFMTSVLVAVLFADAWSPWLALTIAGHGRHQRAGESIEPDDRPVDLERLWDDARSAHEILVATTASVGVVLALTAAPAVSLGAAGAATELLACLVVILRSRHLRGRRPVLAGVASGLLGIVATVASIVCLHPAWLQGTTIAVEAAGLALLVCGALPRARARGRVADAVESLAHVALVPALVLASGALSAIPA